ncbi:DNA-3-methyladenine glycosylase family protein [Frondihabitans australicus]|uniref:3-methyladenine DNA glycosylase/8-oxoguanine DNA glycosylase n=1 Tax=Frondihabitans australicus TaxID=386892 RepID=A0A495IK99_9MICO|nr:DNA-3-methyladenine glycosylase 2 family protein [Frondihabitans australicus]RKR75721.1 3-methyladenine DNA glycosylase/8-oxoguanine DNA glycosylase [Frondihabitans australicus]
MSLDTAAEPSSPASGQVATATTVYRPAEPVHVLQTLRPLVRGGGDPCFRVEAGVVWWGVRTPEGPATLRLGPAASAVEARAWGPGAEWAVANVPELLGRGDDWSGLDVSGHELLSDARRRLPGLRLLRTNLVAQMMIPAVLEQKVTGTEAWRAWRQLVRGHGSVAPGPAPAGLMVPADAATWAKVPSWEWHRAGVGPQRSATIMRVCAVASGLERTLSLGRGGDEVQRRLRSVVGVGVWTAAETSQRAHGDPDSPSVGDYHLPATVGWALIGEPVDDDGMLELLEPYRGHRERVMRLITASGFRKPRFGPRMTIQDHRAH